MSTSALAREMATRLHHRGCFVDPGYAALASDLRDIASLDPERMAADFSRRKVEILSGYGLTTVDNGKPFAFSSGTAIIPIHGILLNRLSWSWSFVTGYEFIRSQLEAALNDPDVDRIIYDVNSNGGEAAGCGELAKEIFESREIKPSLAVVDSRGYSAAYFLGSAATRMVVIPSGGVGSIGCVAMHVDFSNSLEQEGIKITFIKAGDEKVDGNSYEPLSERARNSIQRDVDYQYGLFVDAVARHRGLSEDDVRATEARCYSPPEALELGLIDGVQTPREVIAEFDEYNSEDTITMTTQPQNPSATAPTISNQPLLSATDVKQLVAESIAKALSADRSRVSAIRGCEEAKGREKLADHLALSTSLSVDEAKAILAASAPVTPEAANPKQPANPAFSAAMAGTPNPNVGADPDPASPSGEQADPNATTNRLLGNYAVATGQKVTLIGSRAAA